MNKYISPETQGWGQEILKNKWPYINESVAFGELPTVKNAIEHRNLGSLSYKIKCKWENHKKQAEMRFVGEKEWDCI